MDRRKLMKSITVAGLSMSYIGNVQAKEEQPDQIEIKRVGSGPNALALSWDHIGDEEYQYMVKINGIVVLETSERRCRVLDVADEQVHEIFIEGQPQDSENEVISGSLKIPAGNPEISEQPEEGHIPRDMDKEKFKKLTREEKVEIFKKGNHGCS